MKTNTGLAEYAIKQIGKPYWYGTFGQTSSAQLLAEKKKQYPKYYDQSKYKVVFTKQYGERVHDCVGLIKGYLWSATPTSKPIYNAAQDKGANSLYTMSAKKGAISTMPETIGLCVFMTDHVGVYIGNGEVVEARGHDYGVVKTKLNGRGWQAWAEIPWLDYKTEGKMFKNTSGKTLKIYADSTLKTEIGELYANSTCTFLEEIGGRAVIRYKVLSTGTYKVGFTDYTKGIVK